MHFGSEALSVPLPGFFGLQQKMLPGRVMVLLVCTGAVGSASLAGMSLCRIRGAAQGNISLLWATEISSCRKGVKEAVDTRWLLSGLFREALQTVQWGAAPR